MVALGNLPSCLSGIFQCSSRVRRIGDQAVQLHGARDPLVIDEVTAAPQFMSHTTIATTGKLIFDALDKQSELKIDQGYGGLVGLLIERAVRQFDHLIPCRMGQTSPV